MDARTGRVQMRERTRRFHAALKLAGLSIAKWAKQHDLSRGHVYSVLNGRESPPLIAKIDAFIEQHLGQAA
jgi:gp16 family phage-associated protein